ncbi:MAG: lytic transglycosylase [Pseudomonadota bacterium]
MIRYFSALALLLMLSACGGGRDAQPRNLDNACSIVSQRPAWLNDMQKTERKWGIPVAIQMATIYHESRFVKDARTPLRFALGVIPMGRQSSAYGFSQALDGTWKEYQRDQGRRFARRDRFSDAADFIGWYMDETEERLGISKGDARNQYLAYHEGRAGYARGSYRRKSWLLRVSSEMAARAQTYNAQLITCGKV